MTNANANGTAATPSAESDLIKPNLALWVNNANQ